MVLTAVLGACVLHSDRLRDLLLSLAKTELYHPRWTEAINDEWTESKKAKHPDRGEKLDRTRILVNRSVPDCLITGYESLIPSLDLPDENDRHVLAAAICGGAQVIVTQNIRDFPASIVAAYGIEVWHPDRLIVHLLSLDDARVCAAIKVLRERLKAPAFIPESYLDNLANVGLTLSVSHLRRFMSLI